MKYHKVKDGNYYWAIEAEKLLVGGKDTGICKSHSKCSLVIDSGTSLFTGPTKDLKVLLSKLDTGNGCSNLTDLPSITWVIDGAHYTLKPEEYILTVTENGVE